MEVSYSLRKTIMSLLPVELIERVRINISLRGGQTPLLVLQMGKVGSSSIYEGLRKSRGIHGLPVFHLHYISEESVAKVVSFYRQRSATYIRHHLLVGKILSDKYASDQIEFTNIITAVREPIARKVSAFFENYPQTHPELLNYVGEEFVERAVAKLHEIFEEEASVIRDLGDKWFQNEIYTPFGLDVFSPPEKIKSGCYGFENEKARLVLFKMEQMTGCFLAGTNWLLGKEIPLGVRNLGSQKTYSSDYQAVKVRLKLRESVVREVLSSRLVNSFYANEKETLVKKWT